MERLERYFEFNKLNTTWRTEILAGLTTFITMAYIVFVNPSILRDAGMPVAGVFAATCLSAAFGTILMGAFARYPIALAPGMGLNPYFPYRGVKERGVHWQPQSYSWTDISSTMLHLNIRGAMGLGLLEIVFVFLFVDLFDNVGTLMAVAKKAGLIEKDNQIPRVTSILLTDATATIAGALAGTTTVTSYIECAAGVAVGGRTGVTSIVTGLL